MAKSKKIDDVVLVVQKTRPDTLGTHAVTLNVGVKREDGDGIRYPEAINDIARARDLEWRFYRVNARDVQRGTEVPHALRITCATAQYDARFVDLDACEAMLRTLRTLAKRMAAQREKYGYTEDFAEHALRVANAIGAKKIAVAWDLYTEATGTRRPSWADESYTYRDLGDARGTLDAIGRIDVTARCAACRVPIRDGRTHCLEHESPIVQEAHEAKHAANDGQ